MRWFFPAGAKNCTMTLASAVRLGTGVLLWIGRPSSASRSADLESAFGLAAGFATDGPVEEGTPHGPDFGPGRDRLRRESLAKTNSSPLFFVKKDGSPRLFA